MMVKNITVEGLYGVFNHSVDLNGQGIKLMLGENGLGKTIILKILNSFFTQDYEGLHSYQYEKFSLSFDSNEVIVISKHESEEDKSLFVEYFVNDPEKGVLELKEDLNIFISTYARRRRRTSHHMLEGKYSAFKNNLFGKELDYLVREFLPFSVERIGPERWLDFRKNKLYTTSELFSEFKEHFPSELLRDFTIEYPEWLIRLSTSFQTTFIETQRLLYRSKEGEGEYKNSVVRYSDELIEIIKNKRIEATGLSSQLDKNYPTRVVDEIAKKIDVSDKEVDNGLTELAKKRERFTEVGLLDTAEENYDPIPHKIANSTPEKKLLNVVLQVYIVDSNKKLAVYDELEKKLTVLTKIINKRFHYKKLSISKKNGFVFTSTITNNPIPLAGLSSGEQHELVLFYQLLFNTTPSSLLLIDEPEISLHISWQNHFISDIQEIININSFTVLIATHSPDIIKNNWELAVQLDGLSE